MNTRNTVQKQIVLDAVVALSNHPTAEDVYKYVRMHDPSIGKATVYRNLKQLSNDGRLKRIESVNLADHYDHRCHDHYHIQCTNCNRVYDMDLKYMNRLDNMEAPDDFEITGHDIIFKGLCPDCRNKQE